ncbi:hypothetical protein LXL04_001732 [Taraxacum kok-saghyz]
MKDKNGEESIIDGKTEVGLMRKYSYYLITARPIAQFNGLNFKTTAYIKNPDLAHPILAPFDSEKKKLLLPFDSERKKLLKGIESSRPISSFIEFDELNLFDVDEVDWRSGEGDDDFGGGLICSHERTEGDTEIDIKVILRLSKHTSIIVIKVFDIRRCPTNAASLVKVNLEAKSPLERTSVVPAVPGRHQWKKVGTNLIENEIYLEFHQNNRAAWMPDPVNPSTYEASLIFPQQQL